VLTSIDVNSNQLIGTVPGFESSSRLMGLYLGNNMLTGMIPTTIGSLSSLVHFDLAANGNVVLQSGMSGPIPSELGKCQNLVYVTLSNNLLGGTIPTELGTLTSLELLELWNNRLSGAIPAELSQCTNLTYVDLSGNELTGFVPSSLSRLTNLRKYYLRTSFRILLLHICLSLMMWKYVLRETSPRRQ
jgi:Leucine-rich repeat (LRR) protein